MKKCLIASHFELFFTFSNRKFYECVKKPLKTKKKCLIFDPFTAEEVGRDTSLKFHGVDK